MKKFSVKLLIVLQKKNFFIFKILIYFLIFLLKGILKIKRDIVFAASLYL